MLSGGRNQSIQRFLAPCHGLFIGFSAGYRTDYAPFPLR